MTSKCPCHMLQAKKDFVWLQNGAVQTWVAIPKQSADFEITWPMSYSTPPLTWQKWKHNYTKNKKEKDLSSSRTSFYTPSIKSGCSVLFPTARYFTVCIISYSQILCVYYFLQPESQILCVCYFLCTAIILCSDILQTFCTN